MEQYYIIFVIINIKKMGENMFTEKNRHQRKIDYRHINKKGNRHNKLSIKHLCQYCGKPLQYCVCEQW